MSYTLNPKRYTLTIGWLYPELMSTYGDRGNIICLKKRCEWRGIRVEVKSLDLGFKIDDLRNCNFLFMGGAQDRQQQIVSEDLMRKKAVLQKMIENGTPGLYICGAYQFLGIYYKEADGSIIKGLGILDLYTENPGENNKRLIGNIIVKLDPTLVISGVVSGPPSRWKRSYTLIGFENHGGRTYLGKNVRPLGKVVKGFGNNGIDKTEGTIYKNSFCSYLHGPVLPKNPALADLLIKLTLEKKYAVSLINLPALDDSLEIKARKSIAKRLSIDL